MNDLAPDDLLNMIKSRRTVRKFDPGKSVNDKSLTRILQAGTWAPYSPYYPQRWKFLALKGVLRDQAVGIVSKSHTILKYIRSQYETAPWPRNMKVNKNMNGRNLPKNLQLL